MGMASGKRDRLVTFQRATVVADDYNEEIETWSLLERAWANVLYGTGAERREAAIEQGRQALTLRTLTTPALRSLTLKHRAVLDGEVLDLVGISPIGRHEIEFTAVRAGEEA